MKKPKAQLKISSGRALKLSLVLGLSLATTSLHAITPKIPDADQPDIVAFTPEAAEFLRSKGFKVTFAGDLPSSANIPTLSRINQDLENAGLTATVKTWSHAEKSRLWHAAKYDYGALDLQTHFSKINPGKIKKLKQLSRTPACD